MLDWLWVEIANSTCLEMESTKRGKANKERAKMHSQLLINSAQLKLIPTRVSFQFFAANFGALIAILAAANYVHAQTPIHKQKNLLCAIGLQRHVPHAIEMKSGKRDDWASQGCCVPHIYIYTDSILDSPKESFVSNGGGGLRHGRICYARMLTAAARLFSITSRIPSALFE